MRQKGQILLFNDAELSLIKNTFADNEDLLYSIRKVLLQFKTTEAERKQIKAVMNKEVFAVVKKRVFPDIDEDSPMFQLSDMYQTLTQQMNSKCVEEMEPLFAAKQLEIDYLAQQFEQLKDMDKKVEEIIKLDELKSMKGKTPFDIYVHQTARNYLLSHVDSFLNHLKTIAGEKKESTEEAKKRLTRDSNK